MMHRDDWHSALDDLMAAVNGTGYGASLYKAIAEYHGKPYNKKINFFLICGGCSASMYFAVDRLLHSHMNKTENPPPVACSACGHSGHHDYQGLVA